VAEQQDKATDQKAVEQEQPKAKNIGEDQDNVEVQVQTPDGSVDKAKIGELRDTHGEAMEGPTSADLNPGFYAPRNEEPAGK
jgi:hypothetical protein